MKPEKMNVRTILVIICLVGLLPAAHAEIDFEDRGIPERILAIEDSLLFEKEQEKKSETRSADLSDLKLAKLALMAGDTDKALRYMARLGSAEHPVLGQIIARYMSLAYFMQNDFANSYKSIKSERLNLVSSYEQICLMRVISLMALGKKHSEYKRLGPEYDNCQALTFRFSQNDQFWFSSMMLLSKGDLSRLPGTQLNHFTSILFDNERTRLWLKLALYTNRENEIIKNIALLPEEAYRNIAIRELIGIAYYRAGDIDRAGQFIEDLSSPNADNIRGDMALQKREWEIAYGHFRLALKRKDDSLNALERAIPLAWLLDQWQDGLELLSRYVGDNYDDIKLRTLESALRIKLAQYDTADKNLRYLSSQLLTSSPLDIHLMKSYVALMRGDLPQLKESAAMACRAFDGLNCWIADQLNVWDDITKTVKRTDEINASALSPDELLSEAQNDIQVLKEQVVVDQRDIEELDSRNIILQAPKL